MNRSSLIIGTMLLLLGGLFLLDNLNIIDANVWGLFWPIILIGVGFSILLGAGKRGMRGPRGMMGPGKMGGMHRGPRHMQWDEPHTAASERQADGEEMPDQSYMGDQAEGLDVPLEGASRAHIKFEHGAGKLHLYAGATDDNVLSGNFSRGVEDDVRLSGDTLHVTLKPPADSWAPPFTGADMHNWSVGLNPSVRLRLHVASGANETQLDLRELLVEDLSLETGASSTVVWLPASAGSTHVKVGAGAASIELHVPDGVAANIESESALVGMHIDEQRFPRDGSGGWRSPDYASANNRVDIRLEMGMGSITIH